MVTLDLNDLQLIKVALSAQKAHEEAMLEIFPDEGCVTHLLSLKSRDRAQRLQEAFGSIIDRILESQNGSARIACHL